MNKCKDTISNLPFKKLKRQLKEGTLLDESCELYRQWVFELCVIDSHKKVDLPPHYLDFLCLGEYKSSFLSPDDKTEVLHVLSPRNIRIFDTSRHFIK